MHPTQQKMALTVSDYSGRLVRAVSGVGRTVLEGEVQSPRMSGGMLWFSLTDGSAVLPCKVFQSEARRLEHVPQGGDLVRVQVDRPDWFGRTGQLHLIVSRVRLAGEGQLRRQRQDLIDRFTHEGLCDQERWRPLPWLPRAIGVIAGKDSDAMSDVLRALQDRWPPAHIVTCASLVQGAHAPAQLIDSLGRLQGHPLVDVIILARGGGSVQDLACFDDEGLCRALTACQIPVVCAVGHTDNIPVANHVTWSATTPSRSAEVIVPNMTVLQGAIRGAADQTKLVAERLDRHSQHVIRTDQHGTCMSMLDARLSTASVWTYAARIHLDKRVSAESNDLRDVSATFTAAAHSSALLLSSWSERLMQTARALHRGGELPVVAAFVTRTAAAVAQAARRQAHSHDHDCRPAIADLLTTARVELHRRAETGRRETSQQAAQTARDTAASVNEAQRDASHLAEVISARDFRRHGWLLASTRNGQPIQTVNDISPGQPVQLQLADGSAHGLITSTQPNTGSTKP